MSNVADFLKQYAIESGEMQPDDDDHSFVGADEITVVTDETQTELEESIADTAETVEKLQASDAAAEKVVDAADSLESNLAQIRALTAEGTPLNRTAMQFYIQNCALALEARELPEALFAADVGAMQHSFESNSTEDYSAEAEEKTENVLKRLWNILVAAAKAAATWVTEFFTTIGKSADALANGGKQLQRIGGSIKGKAKSEKIKTSGYKRLVVGGSVNPAQAITEVLATLDSGIRAKIVNPLSTAIDPLVAAANAAEGQSTGRVSLTDVSLGKLTNQSIELPGGFKAEFKLGDGNAALAQLAGAKFNISGGGEGVAESAPLDGAGIAAVGTKLIELARILRTSKTLSDNINKTNSTVLKAADKVVKGEGTKQSKEQTAAARQVLSSALKVVNLSKSVIPAYVGFMASTGKEAYNFAKASAGNHSEKEPKAAPAAKADDKGAADDKK